MPRSIRCLRPIVCMTLGVLSATWCSAQTLEVVAIEGVTPTPEGPIRFVSPPSTVRGDRVIFQTVIDTVSPPDPDAILISTPGGAVALVASIENAELGAAGVYRGDDPARGVDLHPVHRRQIGDGATRHRAVHQGLTTDGASLSARLSAIC